MVFRSEYTDTSKQWLECLSDSANAIATDMPFIIATHSLRYRVIQACGFILYSPDCITQAIHHTISCQPIYQIMASTVASCNTYCSGIGTSANHSRIVDYHKFIPHPKGYVTFAMNVISDLSILCQCRLMTCGLTLILESDVGLPNCYISMHWGAL